MRLSFALLPLSAAVLLSACGSAPKKPQPTPPPATVVSTAGIPSRALMRRCRSLLENGRISAGSCAN